MPDHAQSAPPDVSVHASRHTQLATLDRQALATEQLVNALRGPATNTPNDGRSASQLADEQRTLAEEARVKLREFERAIEDAREIAEEQEREQDRAIMLRQVERHSVHRKQLQAGLRKATLAAKRRMDAQARLDREALLSGATVSSNRVQSNDKAIIRASSAVTDGLRRTTQLMQQEVEKSVLNATTLDESSRMLRAAQGEYRALDGVLRASRQILSRLERGDWTDRLLILFGLLVFCLVVLHIVRRRLWLPNVGWMFSWVWGPLPDDEGVPADNLLRDL